MTAVKRIFPLEAEGAAAEFIGRLGDQDGLHVTDRTAWPRFGIKGPAAAGWMTGAGIELPEPNHLVMSQGMVLLRLGQNDMVVLSEDGAPNAVAALRSRWEQASDPKGYSGWREESWAWLHLDGPALDRTLARCCAIDLRPSAHAVDRIAQTTFAQVDAVVLRRSGGVDILFDIAATGAVLATLRQGGATP